MMSWQLQSRVFVHHQNKPICSWFSPVSVYLLPGVIRANTAKSASRCFEESRERISKLIRKPEISISPYDTAWVAMVPSPNSEPCFPDTLQWLLQNQCPDGSWAQPHHHSLLQKDVISSTLACILALKRWNIAHDHVNRGIRFIESNFTSITNKEQISPMGFDIIFTGMLEYAKDLSLDLNLEPKILNGLISSRNVELKRWYESQSLEIEAYMAYVSEGIGNLQEWKSIMKHQRKNGSLFNSPSTTAAACIFHHMDDGCLDYLHSALNTFGNAVPAVYPLKLYTQLSMVDNFELLGISQHFRKDIESILDETYRCWLQGKEEIFMDASTCALAFRLLRLNGYDITSDQINEVLEEGYLSSFLGGHTRDIHRILESYRASEIVFPNEASLEKHNLRLKSTLEGLSATSCYSNALGRNIGNEVRNALQHPFYAITERYVNRRYIEHYTSDSTRILKTSFCSPSFGNKDFLFLSVADFNKSQRLHQEELKELERWVVENRLDELKFARRKSAYCYVSAATILSSPEQSDARISYAKSAVLATVVDDFFDVGGSLKELNNLIQLVEAWSINLSTECSSENVSILFSALKCTICEIGDYASIQQGRNVTEHIIDTWLELLYAMLRETEWANDSYTPSMDEYMNIARISFALGPVVLPALYLVGPKLSEEMVHYPDYTNLFNLMSTCGRLLNDMQSYERELKQSKKNAVPLYMMNSGGNNITKEEAVAAVKRMIDCNRRELHRLVLNGKNNVLPRACKEVFWRTTVLLQQIYSKGDGYSTDGLVEFMNSIIYEPVPLSES